MLIINFDGAGVPMLSVKTADGAEFNIGRVTQVQLGSADYPLGGLAVQELRVQGWTGSEGHLTRNERRYVTFEERKTE